MTTISRTALVTGAANGIGKATALKLAQDGFRLCLVDRDAHGVEATATAAAAAGGEAIWYQADVTSRSDIESAVDAAHTRFGRIDALANVAGGAGPRNLHQIDEFEDEDWELVIRLNLNSTFYACRAVIPIMRTQGYGRIVNMSSSLAKGRTGPVGTAGGRLAYAAAKSGILGFTHQLAKDVGGYGINVNVVLPWLTLSEPGSRIRERFENLSPEERAAIVAPAPLGRPAEAREVASAIAFLLSEHASYLSGVELPVDGAYLNA